MAAGEPDVLAINPGSTSTKIGLYSGLDQVHVATLRHSDEELAKFAGKPVLDQEEFRGGLVEHKLEGWRCGALAASVGRGGLLRPLPGGTYRVNGVMLDELRRAKRGQHASNLGAFLARRIARRCGSEAFVVDPVSVDEWSPRARYSGTTLIERQCLSHALNTKAVAKRYARDLGKRYDSLRLIVAHLGSGISVSAHEGGRMVDVTNSREEGAFSTERAGGVPAMQLVELCYSGAYSKKEIEDALFRRGGLYSYLGSRDLADIEARAADGNEDAAAVYDAMIYQIAKEIGAMAAVLSGRVDALLVTGGMAYSPMLIRSLRSYVAWIAPICVYPGEDELNAMVEGVLRVLRREEVAHELEADSA